MNEISETTADRFVKDWAAAWNSHAAESIVAHYSEDVTYYSPFAPGLGAGTPFYGRDALRRYVIAALQRYPGLHFGPDFVVAAGAGSIAISYRSVEDLLAIETFILDDYGLVRCAAMPLPPRRGTHDHQPIGDGRREAPKFRITCISRWRLADLVRLRGVPRKTPRR